MPRTTSDESLSMVNFRMPTSLLERIDEISHQKHHNRTTEINEACKHWIDIGGEIFPATLSNTAISEFEKRIDTLTNIVTKELNASSKRITELQTQINVLVKELAEEKKQLLRIIEEGMKRS